MSKSSRRTNGVKLIGCRNDEFWFVESVFDHGDGLAGVTGLICNPVSEVQAEEMMSLDNLEERFVDYWEERYKVAVDEDCPICNGEPQEDGCDDCQYPSLRSFCVEIANCDGINSVIDFPGQEYVDALVAIGEDAEYADCAGAGRIFGNCGQDGPMSLDSFDKVYDRKALVAIVAYEDGAVSYEYAVRVIFG